MLKISNIKAYFNSHPVSGVNNVFFAVNDQNAAKRLDSSVHGVQLCIVYPTATGEGGNDNGRMISRITLLVLEKNGGQSDAADAEFERFEKLQSILFGILDLIGESFSDGEAPFRSLRLSDTLIEPIYNLSGYDGWGIDLYL